MSVLADREKEEQHFALERYLTTFKQVHDIYIQIHSYIQTYIGTSDTTTYYSK